MMLIMGGNKKKKKTSAKINNKTLKQILKMARSWRNITIINKYFL